MQITGDLLMVMSEKGYCHNQPLTLAMSTSLDRFMHRQVDTLKIITHRATRQSDLGTEPLLFLWKLLGMMSCRLTIHDRAEM